MCNFSCRHSYEIIDYVILLNIWVNILCIGISSTITVRMHIPVVVFFECLGQYKYKYECTYLTNK